jgi:hypothetical protein
MEVKERYLSGMMGGAVMWTAVIVRAIPFVGVFALCTLLSGCSVKGICGPLSPQGDPACKELSSGLKGGALPQQQAYVAASFECYKDGQPAGRQCEVHVSANSCQAGVETIRGYDNQRPDVCEVCPGDNQRWPNEYHAGPPKFIQGGTCEGYGYGGNQTSRAPPTQFNLQQSRVASLMGQSGYKLRLVAAEIPPPKESHTGPEECERECATHGTFCLRLDIPSTDAISRKVTKASGMLSDSTRRKISDQEFMDLFDQPRDPCKRGDTILGGAKISNSGDACDLTTDVQALSKSVQVVVHLPATIAGSRVIRPDFMVLTFADEGTAPHIEIKNKTFDDDYGGTVQRVSTSTKRAVISTSNGCIELKSN